MAIFKSLSPKSEKYIFDFLDNREDENPATVVFKRFPLPAEDFIPEIESGALDGLDFQKLEKKDKAETKKLERNLITAMTSALKRIDYDAFLKECVSHFENFFFDGKEIKTVEDFSKISPYAFLPIAADCYQYARKSEEFTMGESKA